MNSQVLLLGYLTQTTQSSRVMTLYGRQLDNKHWDYFAHHEYHPGVRLRIGVKNRLLRDREIVKIPGYTYPFKVNLYEYIRCCPDGKKN